MRRFDLFVLLILICLSCNPAGKPAKNLRTASVPEPDVHLVLPNSLLSRKTEFDSLIRWAGMRLEDFAKKNGWDSLVREPFVDSVMIFDDKKQFNKALLTLAGADTLMNLPESFCGALEKRTLTLMTPEYYAKVYSEGIEAHSFGKLLVHEMAHRLHIRILNGNEEAMGPVWFYEGFAIYAADQFANSDLQLTEAERGEIMNDPERGSYLKYGTIFRFYAEKVTLPELIRKAGMVNQ